MGKFDGYLLGSDLDGTLLNQNAVLSEDTISGLNELIEKGVNFTVVGNHSKWVSK